MCLFFPAYLKAYFLLFLWTDVLGDSDKGLDIYVILQPSGQDDFNCSTFMRPVGVIEEQVFRIN